MCPVCGWRDFSTDVPLDTIRRQIRMRTGFVRSRLGRKGSRSELKDLTEFMHGFPAPLMSCSRCGLLRRGERSVPDADSYKSDPNDLDLMTQLLPRYTGAFRHKEPAYRQLLPPHADVIELGSHLGAFLQTAEEWNWRPIGFDVGADTASFTKSRGFRVYRTVVESSPFRDHSFDAVFVWNCFDQLLDPASTLVASHRALKRHGLLVIRVPNAFFYRSVGRRFRNEEQDGFVLRALAYNNLLGFPYLYGYTAASLNHLVARHGFEYVRGFNSELVTMPFPDVTSRISREQVAVSQAIGRWSSSITLKTGLLTGPWIELVYRKLESGLTRRRQRTVVRATEGCIDLRFLERAS
jgi:hypothetical protein